MNRKILSLLLFGFLSVSGFPPEGICADVSIKESILDGRGNVAGERLRYVSGNRARFDTAGFTAITDLESGKSYYIDHQKKRYSEVDLAAMAASAKSLEKEMESRMGKDGLNILSKRLREEMQIIIFPTGESKVINGFNTIKILIHRGQELIIEGWYTDIPMGAFQKFIDRLKAFPAIEYVYPSEDLEVFKATNFFGYPVQLHYLLSGKTVRTEKISNQPLERSLFQVPDGYTKGEGKERVTFFYSE